MPELNDIFTEDDEPDLPEGEAQEAEEDEPEGASPEVQGLGDDEYEQVDVDEPEERKPRKQQRRERGELHRENQRLRQELEQAKTNQRVGRIEDLASQYPPPGQYQRQLLGEQPPRENPHDAEIARLNQAQDGLAAEYQAAQQGGNISKADMDTFRSRARQIEDDVSRAQYRRNQLEYGGGEQKQTDPRQVAFEVTQMTLRAENSDIYGNEELARIAAGHYAAEQHRLGPDPKTGHPRNSRAMHDRAMEATRRQVGLPTRTQEPTDASRSRLKGRSRGGGTGGGKTSGRTIARTPALQKMADMAFPNVKGERARFQKWANTAGKAMLEDE